MNGYVRVVQVESLAGFREEVPARGENPVLSQVLHPEGVERFRQKIAARFENPVVRLNLSEQRLGGQIPQNRVSVDLMGANGQGEIVWLHFSQKVFGWVRQDQAFGRDVDIYEGMRRMYELVKAHLEGLGYKVRGGRYGIPNSIEPLRGRFECVRWVVGEEEGYRVEAVEEHGLADVGAQTD